MQRLVFCDSVFRGRTFLKWSTYLFIPYSQTPQRALYKSFSGGWEVIFFSALLMFSHSFPGVFAAFSKFQTNKQFPNKLIMCCIRSLCKPMEGNQIMCAPWILECIHLVLRAGLTGAYRKHCMYVYTFALPGNWPRSKVRQFLDYFDAFAKAFFISCSLQLITSINEVSFYTVLLKIFMQLQCKLSCKSNHLQCTAGKQKHYHSFSSVSIAMAQFSPL